MYRTFDDMLVEATFASAMQPSTPMSDAQVLEDLRATLRSVGVAGCRDAVATEFGNHPEDAVRRMRWARSVVRRVRPQFGRHGITTRRLVMSTVAGRDLVAA